MQYHYKNYPIHCQSKSKTLTALHAHIQSNQSFLPIITLNLLMTLELNQHPSLNQWVQKISYITIDGISIAILLSILTKRIIRRYPGIDMAIDLLSNACGYRIALVGGSLSALKKTTLYIQQTFPQHTIVFTHDGYSEFKSSDIHHLVQRQPDITLVAMGCPKQDQMLRMLHKKITNGIGIGIGGAFDIWSGEKTRAPKAIQVLGLEWMYRILKEPSRINRWLKCLNKSDFPTPDHQS